jgi:ABC-type transport system involved in multi-copper enzyme maturation permease subunit
MFTLIIREIEDNRVFFIAAAILVAIFGVLFAWQLYYGEVNDRPFVVIPVLNAIFGMLILCAVGAAQMYRDKTKRISTLLATLAVTRRHIFIARVIAGFLLVFIVFIPIAGATIAAVLTRPIEPSHSVRLLYPEISIPVFLLGFACYCIGLQAGWTSSRVIPTLGPIALGLILIPVILIKGFGWEIYAILVLLIAVCLIRAWYKFSRAAL